MLRLHRGILRMKVAFVVQRCGLEVNGGAESLCLQIAQRLGSFCTVEILTTCALDYMTWENFYPEGTATIGPTVVRRFPVDRPRDVAAFNRLSGELNSKRDKTTLSEQEDWMRAQGPMSSGLLDHLRAAKDSYDAFIFFGYLYATTYFGLPLVRDKAWLEPLAHDEWTIYFRMWDAFFALPKGFIFNTQAERSFLQRRFPGNSLAGPIAGIGIDPPPGVDVEKFKLRYNLSAPFLLYIGRIDASKGCEEMFDYFIRWKQQSNNPYKLVLVGREVMPIPFHDDIIHLGYVSEEEKWAALSACDWVIAPSRFESLSMALLEGWSVARPALVNGACAVLVEHCRKAHGGVWFNDYNEWRMLLDGVDNETKTILGRQGRNYVREYYDWKKVEASYLDALTTS
jgi:glycosyltransferase involved in cell wall biosynthesis